MLAGAAANPVSKSAAFLCPTSAPTGADCVKLVLPAGEEWGALVRGALALLLDPDNFEEGDDSLSALECAQILAEFIGGTFDWTPC